MGYDYRYRIERLKDHDMFFNAWNFAIEHGATKFTGSKFQAEEKLPSPMPPHIEELYVSIRKNRYSHKEALGRAQKEFADAVWRLKENIRKSDRLFANRLYLTWNLTEARALHEELNAKLTKPLEDYARWWVNGYGDSENWEYKHKGADATWRALKRIEDYEAELEEINKLIDGPGPAVNLLLEEAQNAYDILKIIMAGDHQYEQKRKAQSKEKRESQEKRLQERIELAKDYIMVPAVRAGENVWIDHRVLLEGLKGRTSISKSYGHSYIRILDVVIDTAKFKKWLSLTLQDPATGRRIPKNKWDQSNWAHVNVVPQRGLGEMIDMALFFISSVGNMRVSTTLYDISEDVKIAANQGRKPVINEVRLQEVKADHPITKEVWTPDDIETYHPVLA
jgi:hypothetical protein